MQLSSRFGVNSPAAEAGVPPRRGSVDIVLTDGEVHRIFPISVTTFSESGPFVEKLVAGLQ